MFPLTTMVLVVDDSEITRQLNKKILNKIGFKDVLTAESGKEALEIIARTKNIGLILSDWKMPDIDGIELLNSLRLDPKMSQVPFLLISGVKTNSNTYNQLESPLTGFLLKPFGPSDLELAIKHLFKSAHGSHSCL